MSALPPGLPPDEIERRRWHAFGQKRALALRGADDLVQFTAQRGFILLFPQAGVHYPSALEAAVGRPLLEFTRDERCADVERWADAAVAARRLGRLTLFEELPALAAPDWIPQLVQAGGAPPRDAVLELLAAAWPCAPAAPAGPRAALAARFLQNVLVAAVTDVARAFAWTEPEALAVLHALTAQGVARIHPASRARRETFEAVTSDLLEP